VSKAPSFQFYPKDWETDEQVRMMDFAERGFFLTCLNHSWLNDGLPERAEDMAKLFGASRRQTEKLWAKVRICFVFSEKRWRNTKQEVQRSESETFRVSRINAAKSRWLNKDGMHVHNSADMHVQCSASASASANTPPEPLCAESAKPAPSAGKIHQLPDLDIEVVAERIYERHPPQRRCGGSEIRKKLHAIIKRHSRLGKERALATVDKNHAAQCKSEQWSKSGGEFAKGLGNWLAPTEDRYLVEPDAKSRDSPQSLGAAYMPYVDPLRGMV
jgi:hypothetical protein